MKSSNEIEMVSSGADRLLDLHEVAARLKVHVRTIRREVQRGNFPKPVKVVNRMRFFQSEVDAYLQSLKEGRS